MAGKHRSIHQWLLLALLLFPLLQVNLVSIIIFLLCLNTLIYYIRGSDRAWHREAFRLTVPVLLIFVVFSMMSNDLKQASGIIERRLGLLFLPFVFSSVFLNADKKFFARFLDAFCYSALALLLYGNLAILISGFHNENSSIDFSYHYRYSFEIYTHVHPTYVSLLVFTAALFKSQRLLFKKPVYKNRNALILDAVLCILLTVGGILQASRMPAISFFSVLLLQVFLSLKYSSHKRTATVFAAVILLGALAASPVIVKRLSEINLSNIEPPSMGEDNATNVRAGIWRCNFALLQKHWLTGLGTGNVQSALNGCLSQYQTDVYQKLDYNTHNEYINTWLTGGILALGVFLLVLMRSFRRAIKEKNFLYLSFISFISLCLLTENMLERQVGVMVFAIWQSVFANGLLAEWGPEELSEPE